MMMGSMLISRAKFYNVDFVQKLLVIVRNVWELVNALNV